jgi:hypothetical protein
MDFITAHNSGAHEGLMHSHLTGVNATSGTSIDSGEVMAQPGSSPAGQPSTAATLLGHLAATSNASVGSGLVASQTGSSIAGQERTTAAPNIHTISKGSRLAVQVVVANDSIVQLRPLARVPL